MPSSCNVSVLRTSSWQVIRNRSTTAIHSIEEYCQRQHVLVSPAGDFKGLVDDELLKQNYDRRVSVAVTGYALLGPIVSDSELIATVPDFVANDLRSAYDLLVDECPVAVPKVKHTLAWRQVSHADPAEIWFRQQIKDVFYQV